MVPSPCVACRKSEAGIKRKIQACDEELRIGFVEVHISVSGNDKSQRKIWRKIRGPKVVAPECVFPPEVICGWALLGACRGVGPPLQEVYWDGHSLGQALWI